jgi:DNA-binding response OmpR family regulator
LDEDHNTASPVLVVDDDPSVRAIIVNLLSGAGHRVVSAGDGKSALAAARMQPLNLIVLDFITSDVSSLQVIRRLRTWSDVPVLVLTGSDDADIAAECLDLGADDVVTKPFSDRLFLARVRALLRRSTLTAARSEAMLVRGLFRFDLRRGLVTYDGRNVPLSPSEARILSALASEPDRIFGRRHLIDELWGENATVSERLVDALVSGLRVKLAAAGVTEAVVCTLRGRGYRFEVDHESS